VVPKEVLTPLKTYGLQFCVYLTENILDIHFPASRHGFYKTKECTFPVTQNPTKQPKLHPDYFKRPEN